MEFGFCSLDISEKDEDGNQPAIPTANVWKLSLLFNCKKPPQIVAMILSAFDHLGF